MGGPEEPVALAPGVVARRAQYERLSAGVPAGVTLVSAPPGSGKSVLLRSWIDEAGLRARTAWVLVERHERDAQRFWLSVVEAGLEAKVATLRAQRAAARERQRERIDARIEELKTSYATRQAKLEEARRLAKASAEATREALVR